MINMIWQYLTEILEAVVVAQLLNFVGKSWPILLGADQLSAAADGAVQGVEVLQAAGETVGLDAHDKKVGNRRRDMEGWLKNGY
jgi:hypothetical protein